LSKYDASEKENKFDWIEAEEAPDMDESIIGSPDKPFDGSVHSKYESLSLACNQKFW
jgi:hypothetical protein